MTHARLIEATPEHAAAIAADARAADVAELWAQARTTPEQAMRRGLETSVFALTGLIDEAPVCMFGVAPASLLGGIGIPWMIATTAIERHQLTFLRACRPAVAEMRRMFPVLVNAVDARNVLTIRWLRWLGFRLLPARPLGPDGVPFHPFEWRAHV